MIHSQLLSSIPTICHAFAVKDEVVSRVPMLLPIQTHSSDVAMVSQHTEKHKLDGLISSTPGVSLGIVTSDCVPLLLTDPEKRIVSAVHAGWRGTLAEIAKKAVSCMVQNGATRSSIRVSIGPAIGSCCYDIPQNRAQLFSKKFGTHVVLHTADKYYINLQDINYNQLTDVGIASHHIEILRHCTKCNADQYYSYRRGDRDKRMISYIHLV